MPRDKEGPPSRERTPSRSKSTRVASTREGAPRERSVAPRRGHSRSADARAALQAAIAAAEKELDATLVQRVLSSFICGAPKRLLDDYVESGTILGRGAFSFVLAVQRRSSGRPYAAKCVHCQGLAVTERREALRSALAEATILSRLRHPGVISVHDVVLERRRACLLLERCEGGTLLSLVQARVNASKARIANERRAATRIAAAVGALEPKPPPPYCLSEAEARAGLRSAAEALRYIHDKGIVHRDVKLENLLMAQPLDLSTLKLADFGFATSAPREGVSRTPDRGLQGTVEYAAPEILAAYRGRGRPMPPGADADATARPAVDMWSLGVTLFLMLGGYHLFDGSRESDAARKDPSARLDSEFARSPWAGVSAPALQLVRALIAPAAAARLGAAGVLAHAWLREGPEQPLATPSATRSASPHRRARAGAGVLPRREATYGVPMRERTQVIALAPASARSPGGVTPRRAATSRR